jgi:hypothetical protein
MPPAAAAAGRLAEAVRPTSSHTSADPRLPNPALPRRFQDFSARWISYLHYVAAMPFVVAGAVRNEMYGQAFDCSGGLQPDVADAVGRLMPTVGLFQAQVVQQRLRAPGADCVLLGDDMVGYFSYQAATPARAFGILLGYLGVVHVLTFLGVCLVARRERR